MVLLVRKNAHKRNKEHFQKGYNKTLPSDRRVYSSACHTHVRSSDKNPKPNNRENRPAKTRNFPPEQGAEIKRLPLFSACFWFFHLWSALGADCRCLKEISARCVIEKINAGQYHAAGEVPDFFRIHFLTKIMLGKMYVQANTCLLNAYVKVSAFYYVTKII